MNKKSIILALILASLMVGTIVSASWWQNLFTPKNENLSASVLFPYQGGTGTSTTPTADQILIGGDNSRYDVKTLTAGSNITIATSSGLLTISAASVSGVFPFTATTNYGQVVYATSTPTLWFQSGFYASSTSILVRASSSQATIEDAWITKLRNLTSNGFVKSGSSDGTLSVDTNTYLTTIGSGLNGNLAYWTGANTLTEIATTTLTENSLALSLSQPISVIGGSASVLSLATSSLFSYPWEVASGGTSSTTLSGILKGNGTSMIATAVNGTDYTLVVANPCTNQVITALTASGGSTCSSVSNAMLTNFTISGVALGSNLAALTNDATLNGSSYNGSGAISDWGLNLANPNTWTVLQQLNGGASTTQLTVSGNSYLSTIVSGVFNGTPIGTAYGGTGLGAGGLQAGSIPFGNGTSAFATSTALSFDSTTGRLTATNASTTDFTIDNKVIVGYQNISFDAATTTAWTGTSTPKSFGTAVFDEVWVGAYCMTYGGTLMAQFGNGTASTTIMASSTNSYVDFADQTITKGQKRFYQFGTPASTPTYGNCTIKKYYLNDN